MKNEKNALIIGYRDDRIAEHAKALEALRERGLVKKINILASMVSPGIPVSSNEYPVPINYDSETQRASTESGSDDPKRFSRYCTDIRKAISQTASSLIFPTTDRAVIATANVLSDRNSNSAILASCPDQPIVEVFQNKASTYHFFNTHGIFRTPTHKTITTSGLDSLSDEVLLSGTVTPYFAKPACPQSGGSIGADMVSNTEQLRALMAKNPQYSDYLISEFLNGPEINHTVIINPNGSIATQCTYEEIPNDDGKRQRISIWNDELNDFGHRFGERLKASFGALNFRGVYNADFLRNKSGKLVLSEINPGRFPACMGVFSQKGYNLIEPLLLATSGKSKRYQKDYVVGQNFNSK